MYNQDHMLQETAGLHSMYYALAHRVLPELVFRENELEQPDRHFLLEEIPMKEEKAELIPKIDEQTPDDFLLMPESDEEDDLLWAELEAELDELLGSGEVNLFTDPGLLKRSWQEAWQYSDLEELPSLQGYHVEHLVQEEFEILLFTFPRPFRMPQAWMAAAIRSGNKPCRYFTLERSASLEDKQQEKAVLGEWTVDKHHNYGTYRHAPDNREAFLQAVKEKYQMSW